jgi:hypothetical protein
VNEFEWMREDGKRDLKGSIKSCLKLILGEKIKGDKRKNWCEVHTNFSFYPL